MNDEALFLKYAAECLKNTAGWLMELSRLPDATSPASSAPTTGPATKPSASYTGTPVALTENQAAILTQLVEDQSDSSKSTSHPTHYGLTVTLPNCTIQLSIRELRMKSGESKGGCLGVVGPEEVRNLWTDEAVVRVSQETDGVSVTVSPLRERVHEGVSAGESGEGAG